MTKKIIFSVLSIFLAYRSGLLLAELSAVAPAPLSWSKSLLVAILLNLFMTGVFAFPGFVFPSSRLLPSSYYRVRRPGLIRKLYRLLGLRYFRNLLLVAFWGGARARKRYFDGTKSGLDRFDFQTRQSEFGHLAALVSVQLAASFLLVRGFLLLFTFCTLLNIVGNLYPVILQRSHRLQIQRLARLAARKTGARPDAA